LLWIERRERKTFRDFPSGKKFRMRTGQGAHISRQDAIAESKLKLSP
jgi:hypothetical protein